MSENLVIVESPGKIKKIGDYLGDNFKVTASYGHVRDLPEKKLSVDTEKAFEPVYVIPDKQKKRVEELKAAAAKAKTVWLASDEDREGEAIAWHLAQTLGLDPAKTKRIVFHEITKTAITEAIKNPRDIDLNLVMAQQARRVLDRLVGYELSPVLWKKIKSGLSAGRVQSAALRLIVDREREIAEFNSKRYFKVEGIFSTGEKKIKAVLDQKFDTEEEAIAFMKKCSTALFTVETVTKKAGVRTPASPFTTSLLQQEAGRKLGFSVSQTMSTAQKLYEAGLITYMRTDSVNLSSQAIDFAKQTIVETFGEKYSKPRNYKTNTRGAQEAHEAIRPTFSASSEIEGTNFERKLYNLIWKRTIASQMADAKTEKMTIAIGSPAFSEKFVAQSEKIIFDGFLKVYSESFDDEDEEKKESDILVDMPEGTILSTGDIIATETFTPHPARYSEPALIKKIEELGIGRPSTYAPTVKTIIDRGYVIKGDKPATERKYQEILLRNGAITSQVKTEMTGAEKKKLFPENIGISVTDYLKKSFPDIVDYGFTAKVEEEFDKISEGKIAWNKMIGNFYTGFHDEIGKSLTEKVEKNDKVLGTDPVTGKPVTVRLARYGAVVQLGDNTDPDKKFAGLEKGMLIENITLEEALRLLSLPRTVGKYGNGDITVAIGPRGPYVKYVSVEGKTKYVSIPKEYSPYSISEKEALSLIEADIAAAPAGPLAEWKDEGIQVLIGRFGPYIKSKDGNFKIPRGTEPASIDLNAAKSIIEKGKKSKK